MKKTKSPLPCRRRIENPDKASPWPFFCAAVKMPIDGEVLPRIRSYVRPNVFYVSCAYCILYDKGKAK
jgi:hypothetical protein